MKVQLLTPNAKMPRRGTPGSAGLDLFAIEDKIIIPHTWTAVETGVAVELMEDEVGYVRPRSGLAYRHGIDVLGGVIDNDYRNGITVLLMNNSTRELRVDEGNAIAQFVVHKCWIGEPQIVDDLSNTERGLKGFGSTG